MRDAERILWHLDEPFSAPNLYLHWGMFEAASANGIRVLLDGFDGDTAVSHGFTRLTDLARAGEWDTLQAEVTAFSGHHRKSPGVAVRQFVGPRLVELARAARFGSWMSAATEIRRRFGISRRELAFEFGVRAVLPRSVRTLSRVASRRRAPDVAVLRSSLARALQRHRTAVEQLQARRRAFSERDTHLEGLARPLYQLTLETADKAAAAFGIEPRYPFFDRRLIEFCVGLPEDQKFAEGWPRVHLRRAMEGILPPDVQWRATKSNLGPNFYRCFRSVDLARRGAVTATALSPYVRVDRLRDEERRYHAAPNDLQANARALLLFRVAILEAWLEGRTEAPHRAQPASAARSPTAA
jgi:asparagine synthase (glutamine-hydrolysing)